MNTAKKVLYLGKKSRGNLKQQSIINFSVLLGLVLLGLWTLFMYPKTFIEVNVILSLVFLPSLILTFFLFKKIIVACGYAMYLNNNFIYNSLIRILVYILVTLPIGNIIVSVFLFSNFIFADSRNQSYTVKPYNVNESHSRKSNQSYSHAKIKFDNIEKQINFGSVPTDSISSKIIKLRVSKGLFGYYIIRSRRLENNSLNDW